MSDARSAVTRDHDCMTAGRSAETTLV